MTCGVECGGHGGGWEDRIPEGRGTQMAPAWGPSRDGGAGGQTGAEFSLVPVDQEDGEMPGKSTVLGANVPGSNLSTGLAHKPLLSPLLSRLKFL